ncbi:MAG: uroporphyrinogen-III C-methyltransferase, partial [Candidatus Omnitrophota bacterium]|nr:uroporphyrinogen-III C-methyltransferase [Candidatus Omnitrophota bacterium]
MKSTVYLVGAGPGDSKLVTVKGYELIKKADCIIYDYLVSPELLKFRKDGCVLIYAGKKAGAHTLTQNNINRLLARKAKAYRTVVRLKGGDPFIFGRGAEEAAYLRKKKIDFEIVPGVTSAIAVPAYAGIPLTERARTSTVGFITGHEDPAKSTSAINWRALADGLGTMVFLMGVNNLDSISRKLIACGKPENTPVALIQQGTTAKQKTVTGTLKNIVKLSLKNKVTAPAIIVVGETVSLRKELNWFETKPLFSKKIVVTRTRKQASLISERLAALGAEVIEIPVIEIISKKADRELSDAFSRAAYDWIFFTSQNGADEFSGFLKRTGKDSRIFGRAKICAIGPETAKALQSIGIRPDYVPPRFIAEAIVKYFKNKHYKISAMPEARLAAKPRALILRAAKARDILPEGLKRAGFKVRVIDLYDTVIPRESRASLKEALAGGVDLVTFTSSSTVENFINLLGDNYRRKLSGVKFASIGPATSCMIKKLGLKPDIEAKVYTIE